MNSGRGKTSVSGSLATATEMRATATSKGRSGRRTTESAVEWTETQNTQGAVFLLDRGPCWCTASMAVAISISKRQTTAIRCRPTLD